jgi:hypothetical protein
MQQTVWLMGAGIDRHGASQEILADLGELDAEGSHQRVPASRIQGLERQKAPPDAHGRVLTE